jgi:hypothetical protein
VEMALETEIREARGTQHEAGYLGHLLELDGFRH